ncbi:bssS family protein [Rahnella sp. CFA14(1/10)]|uniref:bssS family protein n=1 Tax=Rahnella sp. CFA14(1/10) TaxID=2511203 RepID=UPI0010200BBA|nr:bssS family protein [Rahnella sp. CFA14(1/10)]
MSNKSDIPIFPIAGWKIGPLPGYDALVMKFQFLTSPIQPIEEAQETQFFGLTPDIARALISELQKHIDTVEKFDSSVPTSEKH